MLAPLRHMIPPLVCLCPVVFPQHLWDWSVCIHFIIERKSFCLRTLVSIEIRLLLPYPALDISDVFKLTSLQNTANKLHTQPLYLLFNQRIISSWLELNVSPCYVWSWYHTWCSSLWGRLLVLLIHRVGLVYCCRWRSTVKSLANKLHVLRLQIIFCHMI